ncbi:glycoside hydrolase family 2 TIM barrel-domain containing protein [Paenibacillus yanchengensis]|uniref:beta-galactosidase n=1 Tax=Paenibacillus yanchengensis TaxID=2035833 RepID=A0ABW4YLQ1_9BACL
MANITEQQTTTQLVWTTPVIIPQPVQVKTVETPIVSLNSEAGVTWYVGATQQTADEVVAGKVDTSVWQSIIVPGEPAMQGFDLENDTAYYYKTTVDIPADFAGNHIVLRFNGVYSRASVWVNGQYIRNHKGGFTTWDCELTNVVTAGTSAEIIVQFIDDIEDPSIGSKYAHHNMGGIISSVELIAVPMTHISSFHYVTTFDESFMDATLEVTFTLQLAEQVEQAWVKLQLFDRDNNEVVLQPSLVAVPATAGQQTLQFPLHAVQKWDAEHPYLYTLQAELYRDEAEEKSDIEPEQTIAIKVGFREITYGGQRGTDKRELYVNGERLKLRGTCHHNIHPLLGRTTTPELDREDVLMLKRQNINYVRTSHYPPTKAFLDACDEIGMYVEEETAVNFQYANGPGPWGDDEEWYMNQFTEMLERDRSHPSVLIWSLANESGWRAGSEGDKYRRQLQYLKQIDTSRPAKFSYPWTVEDGTKTDIYSYHYIGYHDDMASYGPFWPKRQDTDIVYDTPVIHDEYAHVACYNLTELYRDNNVRNFWGESLKLFWEKIVRTDGALGGAIWANIDDVFHLPEGVKERHQVHSVGPAAGYGEWGNMSDQWRREKPEFWLTKKAYSPIRLDEKQAIEAGENQATLTIENWFNHTNLQEVLVKYAVYSEDLLLEQAEWMGPDIVPFATGQLTLPKRNWRAGERVELKFYAADNLCVDHYAILVAGETEVSEQVKEVAVGGAWNVTQNNDQLVVANDVISLIYCEQTIQLIAAVVGGEKLIAKGPQLHLEGELLGAWSGKSLAVKEQTAAYVTVQLDGKYDNGLEVIFRQTIFNDGRLQNETEIVANKQLEDSLEFEQMSKRISEVGIAFQLDPAIASVSWNKDGLYNVYPEDHIGRLQGTAVRVRVGATEQPDTYREKPAWPWKDDMRNFFLEEAQDPYKGIVTKDFLSMREYVHHYTVQFEQLKGKVQVEASGDVAARIDYQYERPHLINDRHDQVITYSGHWQKNNDGQAMFGTETLSDEPGATATCTFIGTGIKVYYKKQRSNGKMLVLINNQSAETIDMYSDIGSALYQQVYEVKDLPYGEHNITITVAEAEQPGFVVIDALEVIDQTASKQLEAQLIINSQWRYQQLGWGNYEGEPIEIKGGHKQRQTIRLFS